MLRRLSLPWAYRFGRLGPWLVAQEPRRLCKQLELVGFERLVDADEAPEPLRLHVEPEGPWQAVLWVVAYYRGPVTVRGVEARALADLEAVGVHSESPGVPPAARTERIIEVGPSPGAAALRGSASVVKRETLRVEFHSLESRRVP